MLIQPVDLAPYMARIEQIQRDVNRKPPSVVNPCIWYAGQKQQRIEGLGLPSVLIKTFLEPGANRHGYYDHMVLEIDGVLYGKPVQIILDNRFTHWEMKSDLTQFGYKWE